MTARTKWTIAATLLILLYGLGVAWWWNSLPAPTHEPWLRKEYKMSRMKTH